MDEEFVGVSDRAASLGRGGLVAGGVGRAVSRLTLPVLLLLPAIIIIVGLVGYPLVQTIQLSFTDTRLGDLINGPGEWVGLENYSEVFTDEHLRTSLINTVVFGTACVIGTMVFGFAVALLLNQRLQGNLLFSIAVLLPWAVPSLAASASGSGCSTTLRVRQLVARQPRLRSRSRTTRGSPTASPPTSRSSSPSCGSRSRSSR